MCLACANTSEPATLTVSKPFKIKLGCLFVRESSHERTVKEPKMMQLAIYSNLGLPLVLPFVPANTFASVVLVILPCGNFS